MQHLIKFFFGSHGAHHHASSYAMEELGQPYAVNKE
jgi:hypothetical protein